MKLLYLGRIIQAFFQKFLSRDREEEATLYENRYAFSILQFGHISPMWNWHTEYSLIFLEYYVKVLRLQIL